MNTSRIDLIWKTCDNYQAAKRKMKIKFFFAVVTVGLCARYFSTNSWNCDNPTLDPIRKGKLLEQAESDLSPPFSSRFSLANYKIPESYNMSRLPSKRIPFVFFHQRKAGGTSTRHLLVKWAHENQLKAWIPCFPTTGANESTTPTPCETYVTPHKRDDEYPELYAGHLFFSSFIRTLVVGHLGEGISEADLKPPKHNNYTCFTSFREPISRIQSCYNFRFIQQASNTTKPKQFSELTPEEVSTYLVTGRSRYGEGCLNEPMRMFSDYGMNEDTVNNLHAQPDAVINHALRQTITRAGTCIVGIMERCDDTQKALMKHMPSVAPFFRCSLHRKRGRVKKGTLDGKQSEAVAEAAKYEAEIYKLANKILDLQMQ